jgi:hypothetical protein
MSTPNEVVGDLVKSYSKTDRRDLAVKTPYLMLQGSELHPRQKHKVSGN